MKILSGALVFILLLSTAVGAEVSRPDVKEPILSSGSELEEGPEQLETSSGLTQLKQGLVAGRTASTGAEAQFPDWKTDSEINIKEKGVSVIQALFLCLGVFCLLVYFLKRVNRRGGGGTDRRVRILEKLQVASKTSLVLLELDGKPLLISLGNERVSVLTPGAERQEEVPQISLSKFSEFQDTVCEEDVRLSA